MRVCMVAYTFYETDNRVRRYSETLVKHGAEVDAIVLRRKGQSPYECISGVHVYRIQQRSVNERHPLTYLIKLLIFLISSAWVLTGRHLKSRYDLIHVHSIPDFEVFATVIPRLLGAKVILDIHDIVPELYASKFKVGERSLLFRLLVLLERLSIGYAHHAIVANHIWHERLLARSTSAEHCTTVLNYPDPNIFCASEHNVDNGDSFTIFYPGTLSWHQGVDVAIRALGRLMQQAIDVRLIIAGDGLERRNLEVLAQEHGVRDKLTIINGIPIEEVARLMAIVDLGVEPKRKVSFANEALSTKILEFMATGIPVLASDTAVHKYYFTGLVEFFTSDDDEELAARILELKRSPGRRRELAQQGLAFIRENNWGVKKLIYLQLVDRLLKRDSTVAESVRANKQCTPRLTSPFNK